MPCETEADLWLGMNNLGMNNFRLNIFKDARKKAGRFEPRFFSQKGIISNMKKIFICCLLIGSLAACGGNEDIAAVTQTEPAAQEAQETQEIAPEPEIPTEPEPSIAIGNIIPFGDYQWVVLDLEEDYALIISERIITLRHFHYEMADVTWEMSDMRHYLNSEFFDRFSDEEQLRIRETSIINSDNPWYGTYGGNDTIDKIFLLSLDEVVQYFGDSGALQNQPPNIWWVYDRFNWARRATFEEYDTWWWLRSPGQYGHQIASIYPSGYILVSGGFASADWYGGGVRPAMWINPGDN